MTPIDPCSTDFPCTALIYSNARAARNVFLTPVTPIDPVQPRDGVPELPPEPARPPPERAQPPPEPIFALTDFAHNSSPRLRVERLLGNYGEVRGVQVDHMRFETAPVDIEERINDGVAQLCVVHWYNQRFHLRFRRLIQIVEHAEHNRTISEHEVLLLWRLNDRANRAKHLYL